MITKTSHIFCYFIIICYWSIPGLATERSQVGNYPHTHPNPQSTEEQH
jgi:hypothetical protein